MTDVNIDKKELEITSKENEKATSDDAENEEEVQTTFNEDSLDELLEEGEVENVYEN